jgi:hypothetical protein
MIRFALALIALLAVALFMPGQALAENTQDASVVEVAAVAVVTDVVAAPGGAVCENGVCTAPAATGLVRGQPLKNTRKIVTAPVRGTVRFFRTRKPVRRFLFGRSRGIFRGGCCH